MEDDNTKEDNQPSRKESQRTTSEQDLHNERRKYEERREEHPSRSGSSTSASYSGASGVGASRVDEAAVCPEAPKPPILKRETKPPEKKRRGRRPGRVEKRRRTPARRARTRKAPKRKPRKERDASVSTAFTRLSSSRSADPGCKYCGHRCCRRRSESKRRNIRRCNRKCRRVKQKKIRWNPSLESLYNITKESKRIQVGSRCMMLSPLFIKTNAAGPEELVDEEITHCEVTPEMIYETLRSLTKWRQFLQTAEILDHLKRNYPVNCEDSQLLSELTDKLEVAAIVGILTKVRLKRKVEDYWCLNSALTQRALGKSHVTKFWLVYADTMRPIKKKTEANHSPATEERGETLEWPPRYMDN